MGRKRIEINPECGKRLSQLLEKRGVQQKELAAALNYTPQQISRIVTGRDNFTEEFARKVVDFFKTGDMKNDLFEVVRINWLMCRDNYQTEGDRIDSLSNGKDEIRRLIIRLIQLHGYDFAIMELEPWVVQVSEETIERWKKAGMQEKLDKYYKELEKYKKNPYKEVRYVIESHRSDRDMVLRVLDHSEIDKIISDISDFVEFICGKYMKRPFSDYLHTRNGE